MNEVQLNNIVLNCRLNTNETKQPRTVILIPFTAVLHSCAGSAFPPSKFEITPWISLGKANPSKLLATRKSELLGSIPVPEQQHILCIFLCSGSGQDRVNFCSRQEGAWLGPRGYSIPAHFICQR